MNVRIPEDALKKGYSPNYAQKRKMKRNLEKAYGQKITKEELERYIMVQRLRRGDYRDEDLRKMAGDNISHFDNPKVFPDGTSVKLNYERISARDKKQFSRDYLEWVEANKDIELHITRVNETNGFVGIEEDPRWHFDLFDDLLVKDSNGENFVLPDTIVGAFEDFVDLKSAADEAASKAIENSKNKEKE